MAVGGNVITHSFIAGQDLSAHQYRAVLVAAVDFSVIPASQNTVQRAMGILQNDPTSGHDARVAILGVSKAVAGGTVTRGTQASHDSSGAVIAATSGLVVLGMFCESGVVGDTVTVALGVGAGLGIV